MKRLLLDSHVLLWYTEGNPKLPAAAAHEIATTRQVFVSIATIWELTIKMSHGKLATRSVRDLAVAAGCGLLPVEAEHAEAIVSFPRFHGDPFDHLLLAQAKVEGLTLMTHDDTLARYGVPVLLV